jgi:hypothetical protein
MPQIASLSSQHYDDYGKPRPHPYHLGIPGQQPQSLGEVMSKKVIEQSLDCSQTARLDSVCLGMCHAKAKVQRDGQRDCCLYRYG